MVGTSRMKPSVLLEELGEMSADVIKMLRNNTSSTGAKAGSE